MSVPSSNILAQALSVIKSTPVMYYQNTGRTTNAAGYDVATFAAGIMIKAGSLQPIPKSRYTQLNLDFQKTYFNWYVPNLPVLDLQRDVSGDQVEYNGRRLQVESLTDWLTIDGWKAVLMVEIGAAIPTIPQV